MKILFHSQYFPPELGAGATRIGELAKIVSNSVGPVTVISEMPFYMLSEIPPRYEKKGFLKEDLDGISVIRTYVSKTARKDFKEQLKMYLSFMVSSIVGSLFSGPADVVISSSPPLTVGLAGWLIARLKGAKFVFDVRDLWPESAVQLGALKSKFLIKAAESLERFIYDRADGIVVVTGPSAEFIRNRCSDPDKKIEWVSNGVDSEFFTPPKGKNKILLEEHKLSSKFVVGYIGTIGLIHAFETIPQVAHELKENTNIHFLVVGDGISKEESIKLSNSLGLSNITWIPAQPRNKIKEYYSLLDIGLAPMKKSPLFTTTVPAKFYEYLSQGIPVVLGVDGVARKLLEESAGGIFVEPENPKDYAEKIQELYNNRDRLAQMGKHGRNYVVKHFDRTALARKLESFLASAID